MDWTRRRTTAGGWLALVMVLSACSGQAPTAPTTPTTTAARVAPDTREPLGTSVTLQFVSGETGEPVAGADIVVGATQYRTNEAGEVHLAENLTLPAGIEASSSDYLLRETALADPFGTGLTLWPRHSPTGLDETLTRQLVYTDAAGGPSGGMPLRRLTASRVSVVPAAAILSDLPARHAIEEAASALTEATGGAVQFVVEANPGPGIVARVMIDPADPAMGHHSALTYRTVEGGAIVGARIVFASLAVARSRGIVTHEVGHVFGLEHSFDPRDLMYPMVAEGKHLSSRESLAIGLMLKRRPGNRFPDNDRVGPGAMGRQTVVIACAR